jgi:Protein of unknown function (DUF4058)
VPIHDWTRVSAGTFHDFHCSLVVETRYVLNKGLLPPDFYAQAEQCAGEVGPDVLTLRVNGHGAEQPSECPSGTTAVAVAPPQVSFTAETETDYYTQRRRSLVIRHSSDDRIIALIEILSPGNKASRHAFRAFLDKAVSALQQGYHLLLVDFFPPTPRDPQGIHGAVWSEFVDDSYQAPADKSLTLVAYSAGPKTRAYVEPITAADELPDMPLFLDSQSYVSVPLGKIYQAAWEGVPRRWQKVLEAP